MKVIYRDFDFTFDEYNRPSMREIESSFEFEQKYEFETCTYYRLKSGYFKILNKDWILRYEE